MKDLWSEKTACIRDYGAEATMRPGCILFSRDKDCFNTSQGILIRSVFYKIMQIIGSGSYVNIRTKQADERKPP